MPDYAVSQTVASAHFDRLLQPDRKAALIEDVLDLFESTAPRVRQDGGLVAGVRMITAWVISGVNLSDLSKNTDASGRLWVRVTANGGNWDIHVYKALSAASEVMTATNVAAGAAATLAEANSSGMSGTCLLGSNAATIAADTYSLQLFLGFAEMDRQIYNGVHQEDGELLAAQQALNTQIVRALDGLLTACNRSPESASFRKQMGRLWYVDPALPYKSEATEIDEGAVTVTPDSALERLRQNWAANTTVQKVAVTTIAAGSASYAGSNSGASTATLGSPGPNLEPGTVQAVCVVEGPSFDDIAFDVSFVPTDGKGAIRAKNRLTVSKTWDDPNIPISISLRPTYLLSGDDGDGTDVAAASSITAMTGLDADNSDDGKLYGLVSGTSGAWVYKFYSDSSRSLLVAQATAVAANAAFQATSRNKSGVTVGWVAGSAPADGDTFAIDMQPHKKGTSTTAPDSFTIAITRSALGRIQDTARRYHGWKYHQASSPTFADTFLARGSLFLDGGY